MNKKRRGARKRLSGVIQPYPKQQSAIHKSQKRSNPRAPSDFQFEKHFSSHTVEMPFWKDQREDDYIKAPLKRKGWTQTGTMGSGKKVSRLRSKRRQGVGKGRRSERRAAQKRNMIQAEISMRADNDSNNFGLERGVIGEISYVQPEGAEFQNVYDILERQNKVVGRRSEKKGGNKELVLIPTSQDSLSFLRCQSTSKKMPIDGSSKRIKSDSQFIFYLKYFILL